MSGGRALAFIVAALVVAAPGCIAIPYPIPHHVVPARIHGHADVEHPDLRPFRVGVTTREEVLLHLGEPECVLAGERTFVYVGDDRRYGVFWATGYGYSGIGGTTEFGFLVALRIAFDEAGRIAEVRTFEQDAGAFETEAKFLARLADTR